MNKQQSDIIINLFERPFVSQRVLSDNTGYSLGVINNNLKQLLCERYIDDNNILTKKSIDMLQKYTPCNAIILAAGYGMRMVPINTEIPKALLKVNGECLIERQIKQLNEIGIANIYVVVGFMKERFEWLIDEYGVNLIVNEEYAEKNNIYSLKKALKYLGNTYIVPCDIWFEKNPFCKNQLYSWYMLGDAVNNNSYVKLNRKSEVVKMREIGDGSPMIGVAYINKDDSHYLKKQILSLTENGNNVDFFWEEALYVKKSALKKMFIYGKFFSSSYAKEINTYEQLRELDSHSEQLKNKAIFEIANVFNVKSAEIVNISVLKKGMTNRSFVFECKNKKYIMRIPGEGTDMLINRSQEAEVYNVISDKCLCDNIKYINPHNGYKITEFFNNSRVCDPENISDLKKCMAKLKYFHELSLCVDHEFDIFKQIDFYESLWLGNDSVYCDYKDTKEKIFSLRQFIDMHVEKKVLTHIDAVSDNFLFFYNQDGEEEIRLIDWEYAGMQDPHVDIAMFCIYALYNKCQIDALIDIYFDNHCTEMIRTKIYCYISVCGLLWSNWCEYKHHLGVEFGEYSLRQYRFAKDYYKIAMDRIKPKGEFNNA